MDYYEMQEQIEIIVENMLSNIPFVSAGLVGLDERCGRIKIGEDFIAVKIHNDQRLQYYGGFEYISKELRKEYGEWVFYEVEDDDCRVASCIEYYNEKVNSMKLKTTIVGLVAVLNTTMKR